MTTTMMMIPVTQIIFLIQSLCFFCVLGTGEAFVPTSSRTTTIVSASNTHRPPRSLHQHEETAFFVLQPLTRLYYYYDTSSSFLEENTNTMLVVGGGVPSSTTTSLLVSAGAGDIILDLIKDISFILGSILLIMIGIFIYFNTYITNQAAQQLQSDVEMKYPDLWNIYDCKLQESNESLANRKDLLQELRLEFAKREAKEEKQQQRNNNEQGTNQSIK